MSVSEELISRAKRPLTEAERARLRTLTLANLGAAGGELGSARTLVEALDQHPDTAAERAMRFGVLLHARTQDDFFPRGRCHPGAVALAAAMALEETEDRLLECLAVGYKVTCLVSAAYSAEAQRRGLRPSGVFAALGGAATAAQVAGLDDKQTARAVGLAAANSGGTNQAWISGSDEWLVQVGLASRLSVEAAELAAAGVRSAPDALEGRAGWAAAFFGDEGATALRAELDSDRSTDLLSEVATKPYPVSGIAQVPTELAVRGHADIAGSSDPVSVIVRMNEAEAAYPGTNPTAPVQTRAAALMSMRHCVACGLIEGGVPLDRLENPRDSRLGRLAAVIKVEPESRLDETEAVLEVVTGNGSTRLDGSGSTILYPDWESLSSDIEGLARRSEAPLDFIRSLRDEIGTERPDARMLSSAFEEVTA